ncbi:MAG: transcription termination/antitermination NusG family protein [Xanthobacteraceae bacterium]
MDASPSPLWNLLRVAPNCEQKVRRQCDELGFSSYYPLGARLSTRRSRFGDRRQVVVRLPAMPGYMFISFPAGPHYDLFTPDTRWREHPVPLGTIEVGDFIFGPILKEQHPIDGALAWVASGGRPANVASVVVTDLQARERAGEFDETVMDPGGRFYLPRWVRREAAVMVIEGAFRGTRGTIIKIISKAAVRVKISADYATFPISIPIDHLEPHDVLTNVS